MTKRFSAPVLIVLLVLNFVSPTAAFDKKTINVFSATSLTDVFKRIGREFESAHPGVKVRFNFGASNVLALQIKEGAPCDVFASASMSPANQLRDAREITDTLVIFARNRLIVVVPLDNPARIRDWKGVAQPNAKLVLASPGVPAGDYARAILFLRITSTLLRRSLSPRPLHGIFRCFFTMPTTEGWA